MIVYVFIEDLQMDSNRREIHTQGQKYAWLGNMLLDGIRTFTTGAARSADAITDTKPLEGDGLYRLFNTIEYVLNTNYMSGVLVRTGAIIQFHYETFHNVVEFCPPVVLYGYVNTGRTTFLENPSLST